MLIQENYLLTHNSIKTADTYQVSHTTVLNWHHRFQIAGNLDNRSSAPLHPHRTHEFNHLYLLYYLYKTAGNTVPDIEDYFEKNNIRFPRSSIYYHLKLWWLIAERKTNKKRITGKFKKYEPGFLHIDITYWPKIDGVKYYIHIAVDRSTRLMYLELHSDKKASTTAAFLESAIAFFPFHIHRVLTDNGKEYTLNNHKGNKESNLTWVFDFICEAYGISHRRTEPYTPQTNGLVERLNGTVKWATLKIHTYANKEDMNSDLLSFMLIYILERKHTSLMSEYRVKTPYQALEHWYNLNPELFHKTPLDFKEKLLTIRANL